MSPARPARPSARAEGADRFGAIEVRGARENNLQSISVDIPRRRIKSLTGKHLAARLG